MLLPLTPLVVPLLTAIATLFARRSRPLQQTLALIGACILLGCCVTLFAEVWVNGTLSVGLSGWRAPFGISVVVDTLSASMTTATALVHVAVTTHGLASADEDRRRSDFWPLANTLVMGVQGAFITGDIFNLYVWFEVLLLSSFVLVALGNTRFQIESASKYVVLNLLSSVSFLVGIALLYGSTGTLNLADLAGQLRNSEVPPLLPAISGLFVVGFGIKAGMVPFSLWLPSAYGSPPATLAALLAGLLTKVGIYSFLRVGVLLFHEPVRGFSGVLWAGALASVVLGALGALSQTRLRSVLVHTVVFAVGFMLLGVATGSQAGLTAAIFYLLTDMLVVTTLILVGGEVERITGGTLLRDMGGIYRRHPILAISFIIVAFSVAGFPPFVGFWGKVALFEAAVAAGQWPAMLIALAGSAVVLAAIAQAWSLGFWKESPIPAKGSRPEWGRRVPIAGLILIVVALSLNPGPLFDVAARSAADVTDIEGYRRAVFE